MQTLNPVTHSRGSRRSASNALHKLHARPWGGGGWGCNKVTVICAILFQGWSCYPGLLGERRNVPLVSQRTEGLWGKGSPQADKQGKVKHDQCNWTSLTHLSKSFRQIYCQALIFNDAEVQYALRYLGRASNGDVKKCRSILFLPRKQNHYQNQTQVLLEETRSLKLVSRTASTSTCFTFPVMTKQRGMNVKCLVNPSWC